MTDDKLAGRRKEKILSRYKHSVIFHLIYSCCDVISKVPVNKCVRVWVRAWVWVRVHVYVCVRGCMRVWVCACVGTCVHVCVCA